MKEFFPFCLQILILISIYAKIAVKSLLFFRLHLLVFFNIFLLACPIWLPIFFLYFQNEPELGTEIDPGMVMTPFPSSILGRNLNPQPYDHESNSLTTRPD
jgi:hypothetical protein